MQFHKRSFRGKAKSLYTEVSRKAYKPIPALPADKSPEPPLMPQSHVPDKTYGVDRLNVNPESDTYQEDVHAKRSPRELFKIIRELMKGNFQEMQDTFYELDEQNTKRLSQETMYHLMKK